MKRVAELILVSFRFGKVRTGQINFITIAQRFGWAVDLTNDARARLLSHNEWCGFRICLRFTWNNLMENKYLNRAKQPENEGKKFVAQVC